MTTSHRRQAVPLVALDEVVAIDDSRIVTRKAITGNESFFPGHYPDNPVYPGVFIVEAVNQAVRRYAEALNLWARLRSVISTRFQSPLQPGDVLQTSCVCTRESATARLDVKAVCSSASGKVAEVKAVFELEDN
jgi:3-hydroxyacyl-[acyl-carrier-protein] dehydratase